VLLGVTLCVFVSTALVSVAKVMRCVQCCLVIVVVVAAAAAAAVAVVVFIHCILKTVQSPVHCSFKMTSVFCESPV